MNKYLPILLVVVFFSLFIFPVKTLAAPSPSAGVGVSIGIGQLGDPDQWTTDKDVTFAGKLTARSKDVLNWVIANYEWMHLQDDSTKPLYNVNPFDAIWVVFKNIVYGFLSLFIITAAFLLIISRGQSITVKKFVPRFILVLVLVTFSFSLIQFLYAITDVTQGFFFKVKDTTAPDGRRFINSTDLLSISFDYKDFIGFKKVGEKDADDQPILPEEYEESAFVHLLLAKLTAVTYFTMFLILIIRKIILWFFIVVSPVFPLLLIFYPLRNTAKIWIGEFFRWVLYAPLFAIFLAGVVALWQLYIPVNLKLACDKGEIDQIQYPTAINILLGGPCQNVTPVNNLNDPSSFIQYIIALVMLWMVIIMPFILLRIFLSYFNNYSFSESGLVKFLLNAKKPVSPPPSSIHKAPAAGLVKFPPPPPPPIKPTGFSFTGLAREIPRAIERGLFSIIPAFIGNYQNQANIVEALKMANLHIPSLRDIPFLEKALLSKNILERDRVNKLTEGIRRVGGTSVITTTFEKQEFGKIRENLLKESQTGNPVAASIMEATKKPSEARLPVSNSIQIINLDDYEEIKKTWQDNYKTLEPPTDERGNPRTRREWLKDEIIRIPVTIELLLSLDPEKEKKGKDMVATILPFLLLGGFSKAEVVAYLKAKLSAAQMQLREEEKKEGEEFVEIEAKKEEKPKTMEAEAALPADEKPLGEQTPKIFSGKAEDKKDQNT